MFGTLNKKLNKILGKSNFNFQFPYNVIALIFNPYYFVRRNLYRNIKPYSKYLKGRLLDFGCGCKPYRKFFDDVTEYIGLDIDDRGLDHKNQDIDVFYDGKKIPFEDEHFDSLFTTEVFEHVPNLEEIIPEIYRVLKPGGDMVVTVPFVWNEHGLPYDFNRFTRYGIENLLKKYGFEVIKTEISTTYIEMLFQLWMEYIRHSFRKLSSRGWLTMLVQIIFIFPAALVGCLFNFILPKNESLYGDTIILCQKK